MMNWAGLGQHRQSDDRILCHDRKEEQTKWKRGNRSSHSSKKKKWNERRERKGKNQKITLKRERDRYRDRDGEKEGLCSFICPSSINKAVHSVLRSMAFAQMWQGALNDGRQIPGKQTAIVEKKLAERTIATTRWWWCVDNSIFVFRVCHGMAARRRSRGGAFCSGDGGHEVEEFNNAGGC